MLFQNTEFIKIAITVCILSICSLFHSLIHFYLCATFCDKIQTQVIKGSTFEMHVKTRFKW